MTSTVCTQCKQPLALDASLVDLAPSSYDMITSSLPRAHDHREPSESEKLAQLPAPSSVKAAWHDSVRSQSSLSSRAQEKQRATGVGVPIPGESFVFLNDSVVHNIPTLPPNPIHPRQQKLSAAARNRPSSPAGSSSKRDSTPQPQPPPAPLAPPSLSPLSHHLESTSRLFRLLSSRTELDHPLCAECTHIVISTLSRQLEETKKERDGYIAFEKEIRKEKEREKRSASPEAIERRIHKLQEEESTAIDELRAAEAERETLEEELLALEREERELAEEEAEYVSPLSK